MTKNQKMLLGVGAVAVAVGYLVYQQNKSKGFSNAVGKFGSTTTKSIMPNPCNKSDGGNSAGTAESCCVAHSCIQDKELGQQCACCRGGFAKNSKNIGCPTSSKLVAAY
jgi:hypothetical protein